MVGEEWDRQWRTLDDYVRWSEGWVSEVSRVVCLGGAVWLFGYTRGLFRLAPLFEARGFELRQHITISKGMRAVAGRHTRKYKMFPVTTETVLYMVRDSRAWVRGLLLGKQRELGLTARDINLALGVDTNGGGMWSFYTGENQDAQVPTRETWGRLCVVLGLDIPYGRFGVTFHLPSGLTDVWDDIDFWSEERVHPTQKPVPLMRRLVEATSDPGDVVLDPFLGSGSCLCGDGAGWGDAGEGPCTSGGCPGSAWGPGRRSTGCWRWGIEAGVGGSLASRGH